MRRLAVLPCLFAAGICYGFLSPYAAVLAFGWKQWAAAVRPVPANVEGDYLA